MAGVLLPGMGWTRRTMIIPPDSTAAWLRLAAWEMWIGVLLGILVGAGVLLVISAPHKLINVVDLSHCYAPPPVALPCERIVYRGGLLDVAFTGLCAVLLLIIGGWLIWELWGAVEPKPVTDDFLKLLQQSFGHSWRNPLKWPWARLLWAYGFTSIGAIGAVLVAMTIWMVVSPPPVGRVDTSQSFTIADP